MTDAQTAARILGVDSTMAYPPARSAESQHLDDMSPCHVFLTAAEVITRYGWGRTKGYRILRSEGFPKPIGGDRYRLDALVEWENAQLATTRGTKAAPSLPARKRTRRTSV